ncbi:UNVERIFIED_CONTAM: hypothetical protein Slati_2681500 [Sesamum latifolium]|uniref:SWIM-type domain-containing protein n=1 Tax=Sesamum latifolium TaxID=2727402 RepID=A0AAW2VZK7_9LAMI
MSHFSCYPRCDILLNNACESFNSNINEARDKLILSLLEWIMEYLMQRLQQNRDRAKKRWKRVLCPKIQKIIDRNIEKLRDCIPIKSNDKHYQISCFDASQYSVNLENAACGCRKWDLSGIPCKHAVSAIFCQGEDIEKYTHQCYRVEAYSMAYQHAIMPINGRSEWKKSDLIPPTPPNPVKKVGRPKKTRRMEPDEPVTKKKKKKPGPIIKEGAKKVKRQQTSVKCGKCGIQGHNARGCTSNATEKEHVADAASQVRHGNEPVIDERSEVNLPPPAPQKLNVRRKGNEPMLEEPQAVMHRRTRSGCIPLPPTPAFKNLLKPTRTAPTMFEQFKQCQKGVKIREPTPFVKGERTSQEQWSSGSTPSIVKGGKKFITMSNLSQAISQVQQKKEKIMEKGRRNCNA